MKLRIGMFLIILFVCAPVFIYANNENSSIHDLNRISDEALQMMKSSRYEDAQKLLEYFSDQFLAYTIGEHSLTAEELRIISVAHQEAVVAAASADMNHDERINKVTKFRLAIDAIYSKYQPLWVEMEEPVMEAFAEVKEAANTGENAQFHAKLNRFLNLYEVIYPSLKLDVEPSKVHQVQTRINFIDKFRAKIVSDEASRSELALLENDLQNIFDQISEDDADPSLWWVIITTGSIIIVTLTYVGWRKYKGDKERKEKETHM